MIKNISLSLSGVPYFINFLDIDSYMNKYYKFDSNTINGLYVGNYINSNFVYDAIITISSLITLSCIIGTNALLLNSSYDQYVSISSIIIQWF